MGSLMSGWDTPVYDPNKVKSMRNKSLTKEEIEAYWRSKKKTEEEHMDQKSPQKGFVTNSKNPNFTRQDLDASMDELIKKKKRSCWWTRSKWAFLNEPPVTGEGSKKQYVSQHHVASSA